MDFAYPKRRRRITVTSTRPADSAQEILPKAPLVVAMPRVRVRPAQAFVANSKRSFDHISTDAPPRPIVVSRLVGRRSAPSVTVVSTDYQGPTQLPVPYKPFIKPTIPPRLVRVPQLPTKAIVIHAAKPIPGPTRSVVGLRPAGRQPVRQPIVAKTIRHYVNLNEFKQPAAVVPRFIVPRGLKPIVTHSPFENRPLVLFPPKAIVVTRSELQRRAPTIYVHTPDPIISPFAPMIVDRLVRGPGKAPQVLRPSLPPVLVPQHPAVAPIIRRPTRVQPIQNRSVVPNRQVTPPQTIYVLCPRKSAPVRMPYVRWTGSALKVFPVLYPTMPPRLSGRALPTKAIFTSTHIPITMTPDPPGESLYDIIAASIAWLRSNPTLVSLFGDSPSTGVYKFTSDFEPRDTNPPYAVFSEPQEHESFESRDNTGRSAVVSGVFTVEVFTTGKLTTRQYSKQIGDWLSDAQLSFTEGELIYIKAVDRQYPTLKASGPGDNIVMFKRATDFEYVFERYITGL